MFISVLPKLKNNNMIKQLILLALLSVPSYMMAQSEWEIPNADKTSAKQKSAQNKKAPKVLEKKYAIGAVPVVDGKVQFETTIHAANLSADAIYERILATMTDLVKENDKYEESRISAVNKTEHIIAATLVEEMVFSDKLLARDFCDFHYTIIVEIKGHDANIKLCRIWYDYDKQRRTHIAPHAEEWITDKESVNKKGTKLYPINGKFRRKTIDRKDEVFALFNNSLTK